MKILRFNEKQKDFRSFTEDEVNAFTEDEQKRLIFAFSDGGDTYLHSLYELKQIQMDDRKLIDYVDDIYDEYGGNMYRTAWIENNQLIEAQVTQN